MNPCVPLSMGECLCSMMCDCDRHDTVVACTQLACGAWYFDELSRTSTVVLKSLRGSSPSGSYNFTLCTTANGCLPSPVQTAPVIFGPKMYW